MVKPVAAAVADPACDDAILLTKCGGELGVVRRVRLGYGLSS